MMEMLKPFIFRLILIMLLFCFFNIYTAFAAEPVKSRILFVKDSVEFDIPFPNMQIEEFLDRSIGYVPKDIVRDGLPDFGSARDDWKGKERRHLGYDIYVNTIEICVTADGTVSSIGNGERAGLYVRVSHANNIQTMYIHLTKVLVKKEQKVKKGDVIGRIDGVSGNAFEPQLHFELKINSVSVDLLKYIKEYYKNDVIITGKIEKYIQGLKINKEKRLTLVKKILKTNK